MAKTIASSVGMTNAWVAEQGVRRNPIRRTIKERWSLGRFLRIALHLMDRVLTHRVDRQIQSGRRSTARWAFGDVPSNCRRNRADAATNPLCMAMLNLRTTR
jgi:hypothetical protein